MKLARVEFPFCEVITALCTYVVFILGKIVYISGYRLSLTLDTEIFLQIIDYLLLTELMVCIGMSAQYLEYIDVEHFL